MPRLVLLCICAGAIATTGCRGGSRVPARLVDGRAAAAPAIELAGVGGPVVGTAVRRLDGGPLARYRVASACVGKSEGGLGGGPVVVRVGVLGETVTLRTANGRGWLACDGRGRRGASRHWCGRAFGRVRDGRLDDPRLDLACTDAAGNALAFAWIDPARRARYVVVEHGSYAEAYEVVDGYPVRVASSDVDVEHSSAVFAVSEHDGRGRLLRRYRLVAEVAG